MKRKHIMGTLLVTSMALISTGGVFAVQVATPDGRIVQGDTTGLIVAPVGPSLVVSLYLVPEIPAAPAAMPASFQAANSTGGPVIWGYEAAQSGAHIRAYHAGPPVTTTADCLPMTTPTYDNGRGIAYDPVDGNLWYTSVTFASFLGDGFIWKATPPQAGSPCAFVEQIPFGDGPGGTLQDDIGAIDVDGQTRHIWAAGYKPVTVNNETRAYLYLVNRNNGTTIRSCWVPFRFGGVGNSTLSYARIDGLPGSGQYLLTTAGQGDTTGDILSVIDTNDCRGGNRVTPVAEYTRAIPITGFDFEGPGLMATDLTNLFNLGGPPFSSVADHGPWGDTTKMEDVTLCSINAQLGTAENCPY